MAKGKNLDIHFPPPYYKVWGKHASLFKAEASVCIRQRAPLQINSWKDMCEDDYEGMWKYMKSQLDLSDDVKDHAMKQLQSQYKNRYYNVRKAYRVQKVRLDDVSPEDWDWLIHHKWSNGTRSLKNQVNRSKQEIKSITGTKSIVQTAFDMKEDPKSDKWPDAVNVWKANMRADGTWCIPNGEQIMWG
ncbi:hypothetical protein RIF29_10493 [Crotalaria pallida]|uniref:Uncharacterized protein n=1 Tax=Crotalaria pallida TaxID=3830 RepID=A0AAN9IIE6_CROPI